MTPDPLESLKGFYDECRMAPVPESMFQPPKLPWWRRCAVPLAGLGFGCAVAAAIVATPAAPSTELGIQTARAIARRAMPLDLPAPSQPKTQVSGRGPWSA